LQIRLKMYCKYIHYVGSHKKAESSPAWVEVTLCIYHAGMMKLAVYICWDLLTYVMCLPFILIFIILLFIFEDLISVLCAVEVLACVVVAVAHSTSLSWLVVKAWGTQNSFHRMEPQCCLFSSISHWSPLNLSFSCKSIQCNLDLRYDTAKQLWGQHMLNLFPLGTVNVSGFISSSLIHNADKSPHHRRANFCWSCCINLTSSYLFTVYVIYQFHE